MKDYGHLLRDDPEWAERAAAFSAKVRDVTELLHDVEPRAARHPVALRAAYHDACHLAHAQGRARRSPASCCARIPGLELVEPAEWEICCGSAGVYNLLQPEPAAELGRAQGPQPARHRRRGGDRGQPGLRAADRRPQRAAGPAAARLSPDGAASMSIEGGRPQ